MRKVAGVLSAALCASVAAGIGAASDAAGEGAAGASVSGTEAAAADVAPGAPARDSSWYLLPVLASNPEVGLQYGAMAMVFIPSLAWGDQASSVDVLAFATTNGQSAFAASPNLFLARGRWRVCGRAAYQNWPANFYGIGNDTPDVPERYVATGAVAEAVVERRLGRSWVAGVVATRTDERVDPSPGGQLDGGGIVGSRGGVSAGIGARVAYDTRDNTNAPRTGMLARYQGVVHGTAIASEFAYASHGLGVRHYAGLSSRGTLAAGLYCRACVGDVPFREMSSPDGVFLLRGIENGRYRDDALVAMQVELRLQLGGRAGMTLFAEAAEVAPRFDLMRADGLRMSLGVGFRYVLDRAQRANARIDVGFVDGGVGLVLELREAF